MLIILELPCSSITEKEAIFIIRQDGKKHFNISKWDDYSIKKKDHKFDELIEMVEEKEMPLKSYTYTHSEAKLSDEQIKSVIDWAKEVRFKYSLEPKAE